MTHEHNLQETKNIDHDSINKKKKNSDHINSENMCDEMIKVVNETIIKKKIKNTDNNSNKIKNNKNKDVDKNEIKKKLKSQSIKKEKIVGNNKKRSFTGLFIDPDNNTVIGGKYYGVKPKQAAYKVLSAIYRMYKSQNKEIPNKITLGTSEISKKEGKIYVYVGSREKTNNDNKPFIVKKNKGDKIQEIKYYFRNNIKKIKYDDCKSLIETFVNNNIIKQIGSGKRKKYVLI